MAWNPNTDPAVTGYKLYYGPGSRSYTNVLDTGLATTTSLQGLVPGATYYFAATTYIASGLESDFSVEAAYTVPGNQAPTLDPIANLVLNANAGQQTVSLSGITSGATNESQSLTVTAASSNPALIPNITVNYTSPSTTGTLTFTPAANVSGSATVTVTVDDGGPGNNTTSQSFTVTVNASSQAPTISAIADQVIAPNTPTVPLPFTIGDAQTPAASLTLSGLSTSQSLVPNSQIVFGGSGSNRTVTVTPTAGQIGEADITITVSDGSLTASSTFHLSVVSNTPASTSWTLWWQHKAGYLALWSMDRTNQVSVSGLNPAKVDPCWQTAAVGDLVGDGQTDLLWQHTNGYLAAWAMQGANCTDVAALSPASVDRTWRIAAAADFNGDGLADIIWQHPTGWLAVWEMSGATATDVVQLNPSRVDPTWRLAGTGHFTSATSLEILWQHTTGCLALWQMNGTNCTQCVLLNPPRVDPGWQIAATHDLDGDGHTDIIWRHTTGWVAYWRMNGTNCLDVGLLSSAAVDPSWRIVGAK